LDASTAATLLGRVEPFRGLDERARLTVVEHAGRRVVDKGQMVFWQDDPGEAMFVLLEGAVKLVVCSRDRELIELHRHDAPAIFGELALLDAGPRSASAEAVERSTLLVVPAPSCCGCCAATSRWPRRCCAPWGRWSAGPPARSATWRS
jgi:CRP-like cAMP-binding protein